MEDLTHDNRSSALKRHMWRVKRCRIFVALRKKMKLRDLIELVVDYAIQTYAELINHLISHPKRMISFKKEIAENSIDGNLGRTPGFRPRRRDKSYKFAQDLAYFSLERREINVFLRYVDFADEFEHWGILALKNDASISFDDFMLVIERIPGRYRRKELELSSGYRRLIFRPLHKNNRRRVVDL